MKRTFEVQFETSIGPVPVTVTAEVTLIDYLLDGAERGAGTWETILENAVFSAETETGPFPLPIDAIEDLYSSLNKILDQGDY